MDNSDILYKMAENNDVTSVYMVFTNENDFTNENGLAGAKYVEFVPTCGYSGYKRICTNSSCASRKEGVSAFCVPCRCGDVYIKEMGMFPCSFQGGCWKHPKGLCKGDHYINPLTRRPINNVGELEVRNTKLQPGNVLRIPKQMRGDVKEEKVPELLKLFSDFLQPLPGNETTPSVLMEQACLCLDGSFKDLLNLLIHMVHKPCREKCETHISKHDYLAVLKQLLPGVFAEAFKETQ